MEQGIIKKLKEYFKKRDEVVMAFVFGSYTQEREMEESDFDIAIYLKNYPSPELEDKIWFELSELIKKEIDLVCLNSAPASLISNIFRTGTPLIIRDKKLYWKLYLEKSLEAEDFLQFVRDFFRIADLAKSLNPEEETKLLERIHFLKTELQEIEDFKKITFKEYREDRNKRRIIERWVENIINATIDIAKIILASEKKRMPKTYETALLDFGIFIGLNQEESEKFSRLANLRNILAHEYLDILYGRIQNFIEDSLPIYKKIFNFLEKYLK